MGFFDFKIIKRNITFMSVILIMLLTVIFSRSISVAVASAVRNCLNIIIPCLFPMLTMTYFILEAGIPVRLRSFTHNAVSRLFGLSGNCIEGIISGLTGGYNSAIKCAVMLSDEGRIDKEQAKRLALFFTSPGASFTIIFTGIALCGSAAVGLRLYMINVLINISVAYLYNKIRKYCPVPSSEISEATISDSLINAVGSSSRAIISISFNIIFFAYLSCLAENLIPCVQITELIKLAGEVSSAIIHSIEKYPLYITSAIVTFGGFCIFIQNIGDIKKLGISPVAYLGVRILFALLSGFTEYIFSKIFPEAAFTASVYCMRLTASDNYAGTLSLLFLCAVYLLSVNNVRRRHYSTKKVR